MPLAYPPFKSCPCGSGRSYANCCGPAHDGSRPAQSPETLMRARYSAYALGHTEFLLATWHPHHRPAQLHLDDGTRYVGLNVHEASGNEVQFTATLKLGSGEKYLLRERSRFMLLGGRWLYVEDVSPPSLEAAE